jgi:hypothetical protein
MDEFSILEDTFPDTNYLYISCLKRIGWNMVWHPNGEFLKTLEHSGIQIYILEGTIYGCFANQVSDSKIEIQWFGHHLATVKNFEGRIVPDSTTELYKILEVCDPLKVEGLLFNLDILSDND